LCASVRSGAVQLACLQLLFAAGGINPSKTPTLYGGKAPFQSSVYKKIEYQRYEEPFQVLFVPFACILAMLFNELFILLATKLKALNRT